MNQDDSTDIFPVPTLSADKEQWGQANLALVAVATLGRGSTTFVLNRVKREAVVYAFLLKIIFEIF